MSSNPVVLLFNRLRLVVRLLRDPRVPFYLKGIPFLSLVYIVMPIDLIPDVIPALGQLDDLGVFAVALEAFILLSPKHVVAEHMADIAAGRGYGRGYGARGDVIDGEWHTVNHDR